MNINRLCKRVSTITVYNLITDDMDSGQSDKGTPKKRAPKRTIAKPGEPPAGQSSPYSLTLDEEIAALKAEDAWLDQLQVLHHMDVTALRAKLDAFRLHCASDGKERHDSLSDAKQHFNNWLRIVATKQNNDAKNRTESRNRRKGNLLVPDEQKTYGGTF